MTGRPTREPRGWVLEPTVGVVDGVAQRVWVLPDDADGLAPTAVIEWCEALGVPYPHDVWNALGEASDD